MTGALAMLLTLPTFVVPATHSSVAPIGPVDHHEDGSVELRWSASALRLRFTGTGIAVDVQDHPADAGPNVLVAFVDGKRADLTLPAKRSTVRLARGLANEEHELLLLKRTEPVVGSVSIYNFQLDDGAGPLPARRAARSLLVLGDSYATGWGVLGEDARCPFSSATEDVTRSFVGLAAARLFADLAVVAWSGRGLARDFAGQPHDPSNPSVPMLWREVAPRMPPAAPDAIVIALGGNDVAVGVPNRVVTLAATHALLDDVRARYPNAWIVLAAPPPKTAAPSDDALVLRGWLRAVLGKRDDPRLSVIDLPHLDATLGYGCTWHPSARGHEVLAAPLAAELRARLQW